MKDEFFDLAGRTALTGSRQAAIWQLIEQKYNEPHRKYHNLRHLKTMLELTATFETQLARADLVRWAVWFHDLVYQPLASDNEAQSAKKAIELLEGAFQDEQQLQTLEAYILATQTHEASQEDRDLCFFLDFDLWILGQPLEVYLDYTQRIREEYRRVPGLLYKRGRKRVLQHFLDFSRIYQTKTFQEKYEKQARNNLRYELENL